MRLALPTHDGLLVGSGGVQVCCDPQDGVPGDRVFHSGLSGLAQAVLDNVAFRGRVCTASA
jgi:hypothetical protein